MEKEMEIKEVEKALMPMNCLPPVGSLYHYDKTILKTWFCYLREEKKSIEIVKTVSKWYGKNGIKFPTYREFCARYRDFMPPEKPQKKENEENIEPMTAEEMREFRKKVDEILLDGNLKYDNI